MGGDAVKGRAVRIELTAASDMIAEISNLHAELMTELERVSTEFIFKHEEGFEIIGKLRDVLESLEKEMTIR